MLMLSTKKTRIIQRVGQNTTTRLIEGLQNSLKKSRRNSRRRSEINSQKILPEEGFLGQTFKIISEKKTP